MILLIQAEVNVRLLTSETMVAAKEHFINVLNLVKKTFKSTEVDAKLDIMIKFQSGLMFTIIFQRKSHPCFQVPISYFIVNISDI